MWKRSANCKMLSKWEKKPLLLSLFFSHLVLDPGKRQIHEGWGPRPEREQGVYGLANSLQLGPNCSGRAPMSACMLSHSVVLDSAKSPPGSSVHGILQVGEYWSGLPFPSPGDLLDPGIEPPVSCISCTGRQILYH